MRKCLLLLVLLITIHTTGLDAQDQKYNCGLYLSDDGDSSNIFHDKNSSPEKFTAMPVVTSGLVAYYPFSGNADNICGKKRRGISHNVNLVPDRFHTSGKACVFNGKNAWIDCGTIDFARESYTISGWFLAGTVENLLDMDITGFTDPNNIGAPEGYGILVEIESHKLRFLHRYPFNITGGDNCYSKTTLTPGLWYHFAAVRNNNEKKMYIYLNGTLDNFSNYSDGNFTAGLHLSIGRRGLVVPRYFNGFIDDIIVYDRCLNDLEIKLLYNCKAP